MRVKDEERREEKKAKKTERGEKRLRRERESVKILNSNQIRIKKKEEITEKNIEE